MMLPALERDGYTMLRGVLDPRDCEALAAVLPAAQPRSGGVRNALRFGSDLANGHPARCLDAIAATLLGRAAFAVRAILFDKTPVSNWAVPWHQDLAIPVRACHEIPGYRGWSCKRGTWHVQPPTEVLEGMLTLRLHLDRCGDANGPLKVLPGSHRYGRLDASRIAELQAAMHGIECEANVGDVLAMRPLLLHASGKSTRISRRRVLHVEYAAKELPAPLTFVSI